MQSSLGRKPDMKWYMFTSFVVDDLHGNGLAESNRASYYLSKHISRTDREVVSMSTFIDGKGKVVATVLLSEEVDEDRWNDLAEKAQDLGEPFPTA
jgi:hypothetical protein